MISIGLHMGTQQPAVEHGLAEGHNCLCGSKVSDASCNRLTQRNGRVVTLLQMLKVAARQPQASH